MAYHYRFARFAMYTYKVGDTESDGLVWLRGKKEVLEVFVRRFDALFVPTRHHTSSVEPSVEPSVERGRGRQGSRRGAAGEPQEVVRGGRRTGRIEALVI